MKVVNETRNSWELLIKLEYELGQAALLVLYCNGEQRYTIYSGLHIKKSMLDLLCIPMRQARYQITRIPYHRECFRLAWWFGNARERGSAQLRARITKSPDYQITVTPTVYVNIIHTKRMLYYRCRRVVGPPGRMDPLYIERQSSVQIPPLNPTSTISLTLKGGPFAQGVHLPSDTGHLAFLVWGGVRATAKKRSPSMQDAEVHRLLWLLFTDSGCGTYSQATPGQYWTRAVQSATKTNLVPWKTPLCI